MSKIPLLIDTDPGGDDAMAIMMAQGSGMFDIVAICPVNGNSPLRETKRNAMNLACYYGIDTRVAVGANAPLFRGLITNSNFKRMAKFLKKEGEDADFQYGGQMFRFDFPEPERAFDPKPAWDVIYEEAVKAKGELVILAIGPLTDLALAFAKYKDLHRLIRQIVVMGGSAYGGNHTPVAEFNVLIDPYAFQSVLAQGIPFRMVGLEACACGYHTLDEVRELAEANTRISPMLTAYYETIMERARNPQHPAVKNGRMVFYDAVAMATLIDPSVCEYLNTHVEVETRSPIAFGQTVVDKRYGSVANRLKGASDANCEVALNCDREKYVRLMKDCLIRGFGKEGTEDD